MKRIILVTLLCMPMLASAQFFDFNFEFDDPFFAPGRGIDNNWLLPKAEGMRKAAVVSAAGRTLEVYTSSPALQVYTGNWVEENIGKSGAMYRVQNSICLETQNCPDAINHPNFPSPILRPGELFEEQTMYKFL